jgi:hypothetical protein
VSSEPEDSWFIAFVVILLLVGFVVGGAAFGILERSSFPTHYANGYCSALGGSRLTDEACDINGEVVLVK